MDTIRRHIVGQFVLLCEEVEELKEELFNMQIEYGDTSAQAQLVGALLENVIQERNAIVDRFSVKLEELYQYKGEML